MKQAQEDVNRFQKVDSHTRLGSENAQCVLWAAKGHEYTAIETTFRIK